MKPHEKTYQTHPLDFRVLVEPDPHDEGDGWLAVAELRTPIDECKEVGALLSAAPDMARALLALLCDANVCTRAECLNARAALTKAGVLP